MKRTCSTIGYWNEPVDRFIKPLHRTGIEVWFSTVYPEWLAGRKTKAIVLLKFTTGTAAGKTLTALLCRVCFPSARIGFTGLGDSSGSTFSPVMFYVGDGPDRFERAFEAIKPVWIIPKN